MTSPFKALPKAGLWHAVFYFRKPPTARLSELLESAAENLALSLFMQEQPDGKSWKIEMILDKESLAPELAARLNAIEKDAGFVFDGLEISPLPDRDWLAHVYESFPPVIAGSFFIFGSHHEEAPPPDKIPLKIDAATAFGSGEHDTTKGCLLALEHLHRLHPEYKTGLDMGCGSGILAIAAAKLWPDMSLLAIDIDPEAVHVTNRHLAFNNVTDKIRALAGDGYADPSVQKTGPFDLIVANILAGPLIDFAADLAKHLKNGGICVLSGLLKRQAQDVLAAHTQAGLSFESDFPLNDWQTLVLRKK